MLLTETSPTDWPSYLLVHEMTSNLVSIVMPCFNREAFVAAAIESVQAQTYKNWELIAVDDGSTDRTLQILIAASERDRRIKVVRHQINQGRPSIARNTGLAHAQGGYVAFLDSDDSYLPCKTQQLLDFLLLHPQCAVVFGDMHITDQEGVYQRRYLSKFMDDAKDHLISLGGKEYSLDERFFMLLCLRYCAIGMNSCLIARARVLGTNLAFDPHLTMGEDKDLWIRIGMSGGRYGYIDSAVATYRKHNGNITNSSIQGALDESDLARRNSLRAKGVVSHEDQIRLRTREAETLAQLGWVLRKAGSHRRAFLAYANAFRVQPNTLTAVHALKALLPVRASGIS